MKKAKKQKIMSKCLFFKHFFKLCLNLKQNICQKNKKPELFILHFHAYSSVKTPQSKTIRVGIKGSYCASACLGIIPQRASGLEDNGILGRSVVQLCYRLF
jgi:hypothetical protein